VCRPPPSPTPPPTHIHHPTTLRCHIDENTALVIDEAAEILVWSDADITAWQDLLGHDIVTALNRAIDRTPSIKFQDFLQGQITPLTSGGDLKHYFLSKSDQFLYENRQGACEGK
jgi:hypothetical protein